MQNTILDILQSQLESQMTYCDNVTGLERDRTGLDLRGVGDRALVGLQDQGEGGGQIWVGGVELWGWGAYNNLLAIRLKCSVTLLECFVTS